jgi:receptor expression-enhancing protein 5/6
MSFQERAQQHISQLDKEVGGGLELHVPVHTRWRSYLQLSKYPALNNLEQQSSVPKVYVVLGLGALYFFLIFFNIAGEFLVNFAGFLIPGYYSLEALFSQGKADDTHWLTYWVTYAFLTVLESAVNAVYWFRALSRLLPCSSLTFH